MRFWFGVPRSVWIYVATAAVTGMIVVIQNIWDLSKGDWAAWVQAVGSVMALGVTGWLFLAQRSNERAKEADARLAERLDVARRAQSITFWAVEAISKGAESLELGGGAAGLPFRSERLDHLRLMLERLVESSRDYPTSVALLVICQKLDTALVTYKQVPIEHAVDSLLNLRNETQELLDRLAIYQSNLTREAQLRGMDVGQIIRSEEMSKVL